MTRLAALTLAVCLVAPALLGASVDGAWTASIDEKQPDRLSISLTRGGTNHMGSTFRVSAFAGLTDAQIRASAMTPVRFEMRREAGTVAFEGTFRGGKGAGQFDFTPNRSYVDAVRALGVEFELDRRHRERSLDEELFVLALHDVSTSFIRTMIGEGYKVSLDEYLAMRIFEITPEYIHEMRSLGLGSLSADDLVASRIHRVTPQFAAEMKKLGYGKLSLDELTAFRIHGVTAGFIEELRALGYRNVPADDLVSMRIHRVTPEFIRELAAAGHANLAVDELVGLRIHNVDAKTLKTMR